VLNYLNLLVLETDIERMQLCQHIMRVYIYILLCDSLSDDYTKTSIATKEADQSEVKFRVGC